MNRDDNIGIHGSGRIDRQIIEDKTVYEVSSVYAVRFKNPGHAHARPDGFGKRTRFEYHRFPVDNVGCDGAEFPVKRIKMGT